MGNDRQVNAGETESHIPQFFFWTVTGFSEACRGHFLANEMKRLLAFSTLPSFLGKLGMVLIWLLSGLRRCYSSSKSSLSLKQSPSYSHTPFRPIQPARPSFSFFSFFNDSRTTNDNPISGIRQSQLAGSEDPWLVLASSTFCLEDGFRYR